MSIDLKQYLRPGVTLPFCAGCGDRILLRLILRAIDELKINIDDMLFVSGIGCAAWIPSPNFNADTLHTLHGRAIAFATGAKVFNPKLKTVVISGDGDLADIGGNHLIHAARRNIDLTVLCANNMNYGMTGGQVCSTTPKGVRTPTTPGGNPYHPFDLCKLVNAAGATYVARYSVTQPSVLVESIKKALQIEGFSFIDIISPCPTQYGRQHRLGTPRETLKFFENRCIMKEDAKGLSEEELEEKIVTGEFSDGGN
ncbi:MAG: 2-oxoacid:ferredoxin oxidoreductase subunit beta [Dehalococcoidia bacterium]|nr:2-oxoacid:ferredoxin oxidoreductase subunit beta [Dehalococcoidia bacterium]